MEVRSKLYLFCTDASPQTLKMKFKMSIAWCTYLKQILSLIPRWLLYAKADVLLTPYQYVFSIVTAQRVYCSWFGWFGTPL